MLLKTGQCFTEELELNCPTIVACVAALPTGAAAAVGDLVLGKDGKYHAFPAAPAQVAQTLSLVGNTVTLSGGGGSITVPDLDTQDLSISGNVISLTNGGSITLPAAVAGPAFATPAETVAGISTTTIVNPADLAARENIPAQTGVSNDIAAIPAPTAEQSPWATNLLGETLHYAPGLGWQLIKSYTGTLTVNPGSLGPGVVYVAASAVAPRTGSVNIVGTVRAEIVPESTKLTPEVNWIVRVAGVFVQAHYTTGNGLNNATAGALDIPVNAGDNIEFLAFMDSVKMTGELLTIVATASRSVKFQYIA